MRTLAESTSQDVGSGLPTGLDDRLRRITQARNLVLGGTKMADKPNGCGSLLALIAIVLVVGKCVGGDKPADPAPAPSFAETAPAAFTTPDAPLADGAAAPAENDTDASADTDAGTDASLSGEDPVEPAPPPNWSSAGSYTDSDGHEVSSPVYAPQAPDGASAQCRDGTYSFSHHRRGTCSHHGGVAEWL